MKIVKSLLRKVVSKLISVQNDTVVSDEPISLFANVDVQQGCVISPSSIIGEYTYIGMNTTITKAVIGRYCSIANNVSIGDGEHLLDTISTSSYFYEEPYEILTRGECIIGNDVWIATKSIIRRGIKIGNGAVVGANSFVNRDVPDYAVVAGSPAKIIKYRFDTKTINTISESKWWDLDIEDAKKKIIELTAKTSQMT